MPIPAFLGLPKRVEQASSTNRVFLRHARWVVTVINRKPFISAAMI
jgi:hypothetical protein